MTDETTYPIPWGEPGLIVPEPIDDSLMAPLREFVGSPEYKAFMDKAKELFAVCINNPFAGSRLNAILTGEANLPTR